MKLLVANWKMAPETAIQAVTLTKKTHAIARATKKNITTVICPPFIHLQIVSKNARNLFVGAQGVAPVPTIATTGMVSAGMLKGAGVTYCIVGHSESRARGETNDLVKEQLDRLLEKKIIPILCVGEHDRDPHGWYLSTIKDQIESALLNIPKATLKRIVIAYEPVWAIGEHATREATPVECNEMVIFIKKIIADLYDEKVASGMTILYGGSVTEINASVFVTDGGADGLLVGRVSLDPKRFGTLAQRIATVVS